MSMLLIAGTVPIKDLPLTMGKVSRYNDNLILDNKLVPCTQGTGAMISAALETAEYLGIDAPHALVAGDIGEGRGSRSIYEYLTEKVTGLNPSVLALHYCLPVMSLTKRLCEVIDQSNSKPIMIADAGSMYAAKASGMAKAFDIFTPDATEMAFLADPGAVHPAYLSRHFFNADINGTPELVKQAYGSNGAARLLLVKGSTDYIIHEGNILATVSEPDLPVLEAIGGTGDTITGLVSALSFAGLELYQAAIIAARANRTAGEYTRVTPATRISEIIGQFQAVFKEYLSIWREMDCTKGEKTGD